jgi:hypothetical protein
LRLLTCFHFFPLLIVSLEERLFVLTGKEQTSLTVEAREEVKLFFVRWQESLALEELEAVPAEASRTPTVRSNNLLCARERWSDRISDLRGRIERRREAK